MMANQQASTIMLEPRTGPSDSEIAAEAWQLWVSRGVAGSAEQDWLLAEARLLGLA
jgi:hypothetical protein